MTIYAVTIYVEAKNEHKAIDEMEKLILTGEFDRESIEVEKDSEGGFEDDVEEDIWGDDE